MNTNNKTILRLFKKHLIRFFTITVIVIVSISFIYGILEVESKIKTSMNDFYNEQQMHDLYIKSNNPYGFSKEEINYFDNKYDSEMIIKTFCYETEVESLLTRIYSYDLSTYINDLKLIEGHFPNNEQEIVVERETKIFDSYKLGDIVKINNSEYKVCGIVENPLYIVLDDEPSFIMQDESIKNIIYFDQNPMIINDISIRLNINNEINVYDDEYKDIIESEKNEIYKNLSINNISVLSLYENYGFYSLYSYAEKVSIIGYVFVVFFVLITILVIYSTMSRLIDEERSQNACLKTLGYSDYQIIYKYILFVCLAIILGALIASIVGIGFTYIIYNAFKFQYNMPKFPNDANILLYTFSSLGILFSNVILVSVIAYRNVNHKPTYLLRPKTPKAGKKVILEYVSIIWKNLSFKYKSTCRNVLLFKSRFLMTVISIMFSTMLVLAGMGLMDCAFQMKGAESLSLIAIALIFFSGILCALVIYNLTNINVSERNREIATLMVLGYKDREVTGYIYREIYLMSILGALFGIPCGYIFINFVFNLIDFGSVSDINWWTWIIAPLLTIVFSIISTMLLRNKILKTDMNASLKILE